MSAAGAKAARPTPWLFSAKVDLAVFLGSAAASAVALLVGWRAGLLENDAPDWVWIPAVLLVDVAHVYATAFRVYFDPAELQRRPALYLGVPAAAYIVGCALYSEGPLVFWRALAYLAAFHFVRQQYGWVALYRARAHETDRLSRSIDSAAIYLATLYPLAYWHAHLPRRFWWFLEGDFCNLPAAFANLLQVAWCAALGMYAGKSLFNGLRHGLWTPGKDIVVATTALCWYTGIVAFDSDYAFTVTNVLVHGVPYMALVFWYREDRRAAPEAARREIGAGRSRRLAVFLATLWLLAWLEEFCWDRGVWHERAWLFGQGWDWGAWQAWLVPALALPQIIHYVLDGFIWRRAKNPRFVLVSSVT